MRKFILLATLLTVTNTRAQWGLLHVAKDFALRCLQQKAAALTVEQEACVQKMLFDAAQEGDTAALDEAIKNGAKINTPQQRGLTVLHIAIIKRREPAIISKILAHQADVNAQDRDGISSLHYAVNAESISIIRILVAHGAKTDLGDVLGLTPLHWAVRLNNIEPLHALLENKPKLAVVDKNNDTLLHWAVMSGDPAVVALLLKHKVAVNTKDNDGKTPLDLAEWFGENKKDVIALLINAGGRRGVELTQVKDEL